VASQKLKAHQVTQTIRGQSSRIVKEFYGKQAGLTIPMLVWLDDLVGMVKVETIEAERWSQLTEADAERGGFPDLIGLKAALVRAGYRFKPLDTYPLYRVRFTWTVEGRRLLARSFCGGKQLDYRC
jgi:hypothetical protein